ncbi:MAG: hypothetical protein OEM52_06515, partial [bacterium]|nr:hypothetical protein [bacterium]
MRWHNKFTIIGCCAFVTALFLFGCEGKEGSSGKQIALPDHTPPNIEWLLPLATDTLSPGDSLLWKITDDSGVDSIIIYVDGYVFTMGQRDTLLADRYFFVWENAIDSGLHTITARAVDPNGYASLSPTKMINVSRTGYRYLQNFRGILSSPPDGYPLPDTIDGTTRYAVDLQTTRRCSLSSVEFFLSFPESDSTIQNMQFYLLSKRNGAPDAILDSVIVPVRELNNLAFTSIPVNYWLEADSSYYFCLTSPQDNVVVH